MQKKTREKHMKKKIRIKDAKNGEKNKEVKIKT